ncbi:MAG: S8 family serine peptidase [Patescibacteria group bacterium]
MFAGFLVIFALPAQAATSTAPVQTNDTFANKQWYLEDIHAPEAWNVATGSRDVVVAVVDSGVDINHPDLKNNIWTNPEEIAGNNKDDDGDGLVDDVHGWNFVEGSSDVGPIASPSGVEDAWLHGTAVASLIAAEGNNGIGITGVTWHARIMPLVALGPDGTGQDQDIINAIQYAVAHGADIINLSLVGYEHDQALSQAVHDATSQGVLVVSAAGNSDAPQGQDLDALPGYPACDKGAAGHGQLTVTALTRMDTLADFANYGSCVDVSAPGDGIFTARPTTEPTQTSGTVPGYIDGLSGTSLAAPLVSGLAALLKAEHPSWRADELATRIIATSDPVDATNTAMLGKIGQGKINVLRAVTEDAAASELGPFFLEGSARGMSPAVRVLSAEGETVAQFGVGQGGDKRGVRATFIRWDGQDQPDIAVSMAGDTTGAWRIYRMDGVLVASGSLGTDVTGGVFLSASDLTNTGTDELYLGEAGGHRAWLVTQTDEHPEPFSPLADQDARGMLGLTVTGPAPSFLVVPQQGSHEVAVIGDGGSLLATATLASTTLKPPLVVRRGDVPGQAPIYDIASSSTHLVLQADSGGLHRVDTPVTVTQWSETPQGQALNPGWLSYDAWPL